MAEEKIEAAKTAVENAANEVLNGDPVNTCMSFWENYQDDIIYVVKILLIIVLVILIAWFVSRMLRKVILKATERIKSVDESVGRNLAIVSRTFIWLFAALIVLDLMGINTASILTVLGAVGLAVGLAMKDSMSNIAAGLMLLFLHPYKTGDYVDCGSVSGTIRVMGLFCTELETIDGLFVSVPNSTIFGAPVKNYSRNPLRRADITVGIAYEDSLTEGIAVLQELMNKNKSILKDPAPQVLVDNLADSSVNLTLRFWTRNEDYWDVFWEVKEALKPAIESAGLNIPFPQRVVTFVNADANQRKAE